MPIFAHLEGASRVWVPTQAVLFGIQMLPCGGTGNPYAFRLGKGRVVSTAHLQGASHVRGVCGQGNVWVVSLAILW